jgi:hypothetical protein
MYKISIGIRDGATIPPAGSSEHAVHDGLIGAADSDKSKKSRAANQKYSMEYRVTT